jgi:hypothetical protein
MHKTGPGGAVIREVVGSDSPYLPVAIDLFKTIFPDDQHYTPYLRACTLQNSPDHPATFDHVWVIKQGDNPVAVRIFSYVHTRNFGHGAFMGVLAPYRSQGIGSWLVKQTLAQLHTDANYFGHPEPLGYCIEVEPIQSAQNEADQLIHERRLAFHHKCGGIVLDVDYIEPPMIEEVDYIIPAELSGVQPRPMHLVFFPMRPRASLSQAELIDVVEGLYLDVYRLKPDSWYVRRAMNSIQTCEMNHKSAGQGDAFQDDVQTS